MAKLDDVPGFTASIKVRNQPLAEYVDDDIIDLPRTKSIMIEALPDTIFEITAQANADDSTIMGFQASFHVDGKRIDSVNFHAPSLATMGERQVSIVNAGTRIKDDRMLRRYKFASREEMIEKVERKSSSIASLPRHSGKSSVTPSVSYADYPTASTPATSSEIDPSDALELGTIKIKICPVKKISRCEPGSNFQQDTTRARGRNARNVAVRGHTGGLLVIFTRPEAVSPRSWSTVEHFDDREARAVTFVYHYRTREMLEALGVLPNGSEALETVEEDLELVVGQTKEERTGKTSTKRKNVEDDEEYQELPRSKKNKMKREDRGDGSGEDQRARRESSLGGARRFRWSEESFDEETVRNAIASEGKRERWIRK